MAGLNVFKEKDEGREFYTDAKNTFKVFLLGAQPWENGETWVTYNISLDGNFFNVNTYKNRKAFEDGTLVSFRFDASEKIKDSFYRDNFEKVNAIVEAVIKQEAEDAQLVMKESCERKGVDFSPRATEFKFSVGA